LEPSLLRKKILAARDNLSPPDRHAKSMNIIKKVLFLEEVRSRDILFIYVDFRSEVETHFLIAELLRQGKKVVVPVTLVKEKRLLPVAIRDMKKDLVPGYCSIPEPRIELRKNQIIAAGEIETIILPGSVFDEQGGRLGYGGGYYDRFMAYEAPFARRVGLAFELQVVDQLTLQAHDEMLDRIVTEKRIIQGVR
jgi:5-formyltetrahydrofolate cyclo-ligase